MMDANDYHERKKPEPFNISLPLDAAMRKHWIDDNRKSYNPYMMQPPKQFQRHFSSKYVPVP